MAEQIGPQSMFAVTVSIIFDVVVVGSIMCLLGMPEHEEPKSLMKKFKIGISISREKVVGIICWQGCTQCSME